jgi:hypothetical protein
LKEDVKKLTKLRIEIFLLIVIGNKTVMVAEKSVRNQSNNPDSQAIR